MRKKGRKNKKYSAEFKLSVILDMREHSLSYSETIRKYCLGNTGGALQMVQRWERIYLEEGEAGLFVERHGRSNPMEGKKRGRPRKEPLDKAIENDLIAENQRLRERNEWLEMECEYLKKLDALVRAKEQKNGKRPK